VEPKGIRANRHTNSDVSVAKQKTLKEIRGRLRANHGVPFGNLKAVHPAAPGLLREDARGNWYNGRGFEKGTPGGVHLLISA